MKILLGVSLTFTALFFAASCTRHRSAQTGTIQGVSISAVNPNEVRFGNGIACHTYQPPHPISAISSTLKISVNPASPANGRSTRDGASHPALRAFWYHPLYSRYLIPPGCGCLAVFDATDGPCADFARGYQVLNSYALLYYEPGESVKWPFHTIPENVGPSPGPWFSP